MFRMEGKMFKEKINFIKESKQFQDAYNQAWDECPKEKRQLMNLIFFEGSCGVPFADRLVKFIPELFTDIQEKKQEVKKSD